MGNLLQDLRYGLRMLSKNRGFTVVALLTLALGIGANTAIFSVVDSVLLQPLPFSQPDRLVRILATKNGDVTGPSPLDLRDFARNNHTFEQMAVYDIWRKNVSGILGSTEPEQMRVGLMPVAYFQVLGIRPLMGRYFTDEEGQFGKHFVAAISSRFWRNRFHGKSTILGEKILINDESYAIVAVMPDAIPEWLEYGRTDIWTPFAPTAGVWAESLRSARDFSSLGRLKPGVSIEQAQADLTVIANQLAQAHPVDKGVSVILRPLAEKRSGPLRPSLLLLMGAVGLILLIACVNLATLLLARNSARRRELTVRVALGAGKSRLIRQLLSESLLLSLAGGGLGLAIAGWGCEALTRLQPERLIELGQMPLNSRALLFTVCISVITGILFGSVPAFTSSNVNLVEGLKESGRAGTTSVGRQRLRHALVISELALSLMLLVSASLLIQSLLRLGHQDLGFRPDYLLRGHTYLPPLRYTNPQSITHFCDLLGNRLRALPGVENATVTAVHPPSANWTQMFTIDGHPPSQITEVPYTRFGVTDSRYSATLGIPLIAGRDFAPSDTATSLPVALINQKFVRRYFPGENPIGRLVHIGVPPGLGGVAPTIIGGYSNPTFSADVTIIGVMGDAKNNGLAEPVEPQLLTLYSQQPAVNYGFKDIIVRTKSEPHAMAGVIGKQIRAMDADLPFAEVETMNEFLASQTANQQFIATLLSVFAALGLALAVIGVYGVISYLVAQRTQEMGIRIALGATRADVLWPLLSQTLALGVAGIALGLMGAWATRQLTGRLLFGISPADPMTFACAAITLLGVALASSAVPIWQATKVDPIMALRYE